MGLEVGTSIKDLLSDHPASTDQVSQGDDHIRLIKKVLKETFPSDTSEPQIPVYTDKAGMVLTVSGDELSTTWSEPAAIPAAILNTIVRPKFEISGNVVSVGPGSYYIPSNSAFTSWDTTKAVSVGAGTGTYQWWYIYVSATTGDIFSSTTEPVESSVGWFDSNDRCIFAVVQDGSGNLVGINHDGSNYIMYENHIDIGNLASNTSWVPKNAVVPSFCDMSELTFYCDAYGASGQCVWYYRKGSDTTTLGHFVGTNNGSTSAFCINTMVVYTGVGGHFEVMGSLAEPNEYAMAVMSNGYFLPRGL